MLFSLQQIASWTTIVLAIASVLVVASVETPDRIDDCVFEGCSCDLPKVSDDLLDPLIDVNCMVSEDENNEGQEKNNTETSTVFPPRSNSTEFKNLTDIEMTGQEVIEIPAGRFANLSVSSLKLEHNRIEAIRNDIFLGMLSLDVLELSDNRISVIETRALKPIGNTLTELKLDDNQLNTMNPELLSESFSHLTRIASLSLVGNNMSVLPDMSQLKTLTTLILVRNKLTTIGSGLAGVLNLLPTSLTYLNLGYNHFDRVSKYTFTSLVNLKSLDLGNNRISWIDSEAFANTPNLVALLLNGNNLKRIPSISGLNYLQRLDLSEQNSYIKVVSDYAFDRDGKEIAGVKIDLSKNKIAKISERAFCSRREQKPYAYVTAIDLEGNQLVHLNSCVMRQIYWGNLIRNNSLEEKPKLKIKRTPNQTRSRVVRCDCEVTRSQIYVDFEGDCDSAVIKELVDLNLYKCPSLLDPFSRDEIEEICKKLKQFDCAQDDSLDDLYDDDRTFIPAEKLANLSSQVVSFSDLTFSLNNHPGYDLEYRNQNPSTNASVTPLSTSRTFPKAHDSESTLNQNSSMLNKTVGNQTNTKLQKSIELNSKAIRASQISQLTITLNVLVVLLIFFF